ncbi:MAG: hypothetical protein IT236_03895 [Bacteroidia bacterium]|nr:hypothetical protein [Bacteroidia bacterium]
MKSKIILVVSLLFCLQKGRAQNADTLKVFTQLNRVEFAKNIITPKTTIDELIKMLGTPDRIEQSVGIDRHFIYDKLGLAFDGGKIRMVEGISVTFNYDNDKKAAKNKFSGVLKMDDLIVKETTSGEDIKQKTFIKELTCIPGAFCASNPKLPHMVLMMGLNSSSKITNLVFGFLLK